MVTGTIGAILTEYGRCFGLKPGDCCQNLMDPVATQHSSSSIQLLKRHA